MGDDGRGYSGAAAASAANPMRTRRRATSTDLRRAIDCLPRHTKEAMLEGIAANPIIVGAYANPDGICPMLAAHRAGGRTSLIAFARAWDRFAYRGARKARARRATQRELLVLKTYLEASLLEADTPRAELAAARREHLELVRRRRAESGRRGRPEAAPGRRRETERERRPEAEPDRRRPTDQRPGRDRPGDPDRSLELRHRKGWAWTRPVLRYDEYERVLQRLEDGLESTPALSG